MKMTDIYMYLAETCWRSKYKHKWVLSNNYVFILDEYYTGEWKMYNIKKGQVYISYPIYFGHLKLLSAL